MKDTLKLLKVIDPTNLDQIEELLWIHSEDLNMSAEMIDQLLNEVRLTLMKDMSSNDLLGSMILVATQNIQQDPMFDDLAVRLLLTKGYLSALSEYDGEDFDQSYRESFVQYLKWGVEEKLLDRRMLSNFDVYRLAVALKPQRDKDFTFVGLQTAMNRYMMKLRESTQVKETPQFMWIRVAMGLSFEEKDPTKIAIDLYEKLSRKEYTAGGSTMIGAGTTMPTLANCFLLDTEDTIEHIFENVANVAKISKGTGGIGIAITKLRAEGSPIKTNNTFSSGPIPFAKVMDSTLAAIARAGKKKGAMALYMENWHINFNDFLDLKQNAGDDYRRTRTANTAVYLSDEFMKRVQNGEDWYMFDPAEVSDLTELYGSEFSEQYIEYVRKAEAGEMRMWKKVPAREQFKQIITQLQSTSHPWITFKDTINLRALNNNTGTIHGSNLCTEVCLPQNKDNIAVCNLAYVNLTKHVIPENADYGGDVEKNLEQAVDWERLEDSVRLGIRHLDNIIDVGIAPVPEARHSDLNNRAIGLGLMGLSETYEHLGYAYDSPEAYDIVDRIVEFISYVAIDESCDLAEERGTYPNFEGSMWSKGYVPFDTMEKVEQDRGVKLSQDRTYTMDWDRLRERVKKGVRNATVMMIAPNGNSSLTAGTSPGIDPRFALVFSRTTMNGKFLDINRNLIGKLKELKIWEDIRDELISRQGDISQIDLIPDNIKKVYKTSFQIDPLAYVETASRCQKWIDQAMSRNMYFEDRDVEKMMDVYLEAWLRGVKTTYYLHMKPRHTAEQSTIRVNKAKAINKKGFKSVSDAKTASDDNVESDIPTNLSGATSEQQHEQKAPVVRRRVGFGALSQQKDEGSEAEEPTSRQNDAVSQIQPATSRRNDDVSQIQPATSRRNDAVSQIQPATSRQNDAVSKRKSIASQRRGRVEKKINHENAPTKQLNSQHQEDQASSPEKQASSSAPQEKEKETKMQMKSKGKRSKGSERDVAKEKPRSRGFAVITASADSGELADSTMYPPTMKVDQVDMNRIPTIKGNACPVDPAERALCDSCE
ncbi:ribonucleoside-diphosphate reductase subunit alpha [Candidatus Nomurabacteria bacterium]|uniref:Ribonucleoside-diphosphate reductase n=1 Tax=Candidatus Dojkabacteria bacterium TaxID=2099670 RepID=A0A955I0X2_9BACT|nr:ribonucleoside-diphosphate reductase subunit alpha [Candidatus Dojkabacteria bacterium]MCB9789813.1 ribonucleoside-diphosphate reductase subunit alpha [Candidatus Nomurabacteria bacterium]MCB9803563.1 ribonucleoside-diphosphate reductase subunit alpha [Candidatus Nomurabacteria bacterium]